MADKDIRPLVTVDLMVLGPKKDYSGLKILLVKRKEEPYINCWGLPGGFIGPEESCYDAAANALKSATGLKDVFLEQVYTFSRPDRDPRQRTMSVAYMALCQNLPAIRCLDEKVESVWFDIEFTDNMLHIFNFDMGVDIAYQLSTKGFINGNVKYGNLIPTLKSRAKLAFDHVEIIIEAMLKIRREIEYTDLVFSMAEENFTLPDLQAIYEMLLGHSVYKANFRLMVSERIEPVGKKAKSIVGRRLSEVYKLK